MEKVSPEETGELCPECNKLLLENKDGKVKCSECEYEK